jgi:hypothetical protein
MLGGQTDTDPAHHLAAKVMLALVLPRVASGHGLGRDRAAGADKARALHADRHNPIGLKSAALPRARNFRGFRLV